MTHSYSHQTAWRAARCSKGRSAVRTTWVIAHIHAVTIGALIVGRRDVLNGKSGEIHDPVHHVGSDGVGARDCGRN